ncbi:MAG: hypothetical protein ACR2PH_06370 [Desulfobulbia bacterium]
MDFSVGWNFEFELNFSLFEENEISKSNIFYKLGKQQQSRYIEIICILAKLQIPKGYMQPIAFLNLVSNRRPEKCGFGIIKRANP